jgi:hypothetical protein
MKAVKMLFFENAAEHRKQPAIIRCEAKKSQLLSQPSGQSNDPNLQFLQLNQ